MKANEMEDTHGHRISYLRVSVTDRCNERCHYCMPEEMQQWLPRADILTYEEMLRLIRVAATLGVKKIRVTGGEPLVRRDITRFLAEIKTIPGIEEVGLSTNGSLLASNDPAFPDRTIAESIAAAGVTSVNISLDTLDPAGYAQITGRDYLAKVLQGISLVKDLGLTTKLNAVLTKGISEEQIPALLDYAETGGLNLRFIELMPVTTVDVLHEDRFLSLGAAKKIIESAVGPLTPDKGRHGNGPAVYYRTPTGQLVGFIGAMTDLHFCESCNKLRLTCEGLLRPCLGSWLEFDIKSHLRSGATDADLANWFRHVVARKPLEHDFRGSWAPVRPMIAIGG